jgi:hypothetical protein
MINLQGSHVACEKCLNIWHEVYAAVRHNPNSTTEDYQRVDGSPVTWIAPAGNVVIPMGCLTGLLDKNANHEDVCKACKKPLGDDRMIAGDGIIGCDTLEWRYHDKCFYGRYGYID